MLVNPLGAFSPTPAHQKNSGTLFCLSMLFESFYDIEHKTTAFEVVPILLLCNCFFDLAGTEDRRSFFARKSDF